MKRPYVENLGGDLSHLFKHAYLLYRKKPVPSLHLSNRCSLLSLLEDTCIITMQKFDSLDAQGRSHLHVLLSSCVITILANYRPQVINAIGDDNLHKALTLEVNFLF